MLLLHKVGADELDGAGGGTSASVSCEERHATVVALLDELLRHACTACCCFFVAGSPGPVGSVAAGFSFAQPMIARVGKGNSAVLWASLCDANVAHSCRTCVVLEEKLDNFLSCAGPRAWRSMWAVFGFARAFFDNFALNLAIRHYANVWRMPRAHVTYRASPHSAATRDRGAACTAANSSLSLRPSEPPAAP